LPSLRQLEYLITVDEMRHFRRAAQRLSVSQPTLSAQIKALEERLGVQLLERSRSSVILTDAGQQIVEIAKRITRDVQQIRDVAKRSEHAFSGVIRLGVPPTIGPYLLSHVVPRLHRTYSELKLYIREAIPTSLPSDLIEGRHDVLIVPLPLTRQDIETEALFREPLFVALPADHPLAREGELNRADLRAQSILALETGHHLHEQVEAICEEVGAQIQFDFEGTSLDTLRQMVGMGMGLSILPGLYVRSELDKDESVVVKTLKGRTLYRTIGTAWRKGSPKSAEYRQLSDYIREAVRRNFDDFHVF
jgi:LysR family hydrogen peroxide-inducible transcriptional activator